MKIVVDLQGAQTESRYRGIGRYSLALAQAMAQRPRGHDIWLALNALLPESVEPIRAAFDSLIPQEKILVWQAVGPVADARPGNRWRRETGECLREAFLTRLKPDIVHISSLFEGFVNDGLTSVGQLEGTSRTAITLYDLIPLIHRRHYLADPITESWYERKLSNLRRSALWLAISESSRREALQWLNLPEESVVNISTAADAIFRPIQVSSEDSEALRRRYGLTRPFVMYTGGIDHRKNIEGLVRAYAKLPPPTLAAHQLAIICAATDEQLRSLRRAAAECGLAPDDTVFTGFVPDVDMVLLYNLCTVFAFPSWHEGFGLPALEAMSCGAAVVGSNTSSVPEVIGRHDALFDPHAEFEIANKIHAVLTDEAFRRELKHHGLERSKNFSWASTACRALEAFEQLHCRTNAINDSRISVSLPRPRLAYVSPLPPEKSGIADYSAEVLPELANHYEIEVIVEQPHVSDPWIRANCQIRTGEWFSKNRDRYDRVLYHFGNSPFHMHMFRLLDRFPGTVVLHDFFLSSVIAHMEWLGRDPNFWSAALLASHGYHALGQRFAAPDQAEIIWKYPTNLTVLQKANGVIAHSKLAAQLADKWYGRGYSDDWSIIPLPRKVMTNVARVGARAALATEEGAFLVCSFGMIGPSKLNHRLLKAWLASPLAQDPRCRLVFVGENEGGKYGTELLDAIAQSGAADRITATGFVTPTRYCDYLAAADAAVQLRTQSRGETSRAMLDCMAYGVAVIVNAHGTALEVPQNCTLRLADEFSDSELQTALISLRERPSLRQQLGDLAVAHIRSQHNPRQVSDRYRDAIEYFAKAGPQASNTRLLRAVAAVHAPIVEKSAWVAVARAIAANRAPGTCLKQLLVDVSILVQHDAKSGIQRVVRNILIELLRMPLDDYRVEPVYLGHDGIYRYARRFTTELLHCQDSALDDDAIEGNNGDVFLALDFAAHLIPRFPNRFSEFRDRGVKIYFVLYDLLPIRKPEWFPLGTRQCFTPWLEIQAEFADGAVCISRAVANELSDWLNACQIARQRPLNIGWFHLGADRQTSVQGDQERPELDPLFKRLRAHQSVLMVGTLEPRKGHAQSIAAFELLWDRGSESNLVIVGKPGWELGGLLERLRTHPQAGKRLFWLQNANDETLSRLYQTVDGVLMASEGEGFGLPLIEAAVHKRPILARDIPIFREIAGDHASYFSGLMADALAGTLQAWLDDLAGKRAPKSDTMPRLTWHDSARQLTELILAGRWNRQWRPGVAANIRKV